jgi:hypothetical protein
MDARRFVIGTLVGGVAVLATGALIFAMAPFRDFLAYAMNTGAATGVAREPQLLWAVALGALSYSALVTLAVGTRARSLTIGAGIKIGPRARLRRTGFASCVALMLLAPSPSSAQVLQSFEDLALRVNLDDQLRVEAQSGMKATGRLTQLTRDEIAIETTAGEKRFMRDTVRAVAVRGHALREGALVGAGVFAVLGVVAMCSREPEREGSTNCVVRSLGFPPFGAGVGLAIGVLVPQMRAVYRAPENRASVPPSGGALGVQASLLEGLALRVNLDDQLRVDDRSGVATIGRLTRLTAEEITLQTAAGEKHFTRDTVRQIGVRRRPITMAVLIGAGAGAAIGAVAGCAGPDREECPDAWIMAGAPGAGLGLVVGALIHKTTIVYPEPEKRTFIVPAISRGAVGVLVSRRW